MATRLKQIWQEFWGYTWFQKTFFVAVAGGLVFYGLLHGGLIKLPAGRAVDCTGFAAGRTVAIKMLDDKFEPATPSVQLCDTLNFINQSQAERWPAVGPHPTHTSYPGFDSRQPIKPGESFEFVLNRPGNYSFHDHLHAELVGRLEIKK